MNPESLSNVIVPTLLVVALFWTASTEPIILSGLAEVFSVFPLNDKLVPGVILDCFESNCVCMDDVTPST